MILLGRWVLSVGLMLTLFPIAFIVFWHGPDANAGWIGGILWMFFVQFASPYNFWITPVSIGSVVAFAWHVFAARRTTD